MYQYYATLTEGNNQNEVYGYIDAATYDGTGRLTYDTFYGKYWSEEYLMNMYTLATHKVIGCFSHCLDSYFVDLSLETYGFDAVDYSYNEDALLTDYAFILSFLLECTNSFMGSVSAELSIRDLGFLFFNI